MADTVGEPRGDGKPDPLGSRALRSLDSRDATCKGGAVVSFCSDLESYAGPCEEPAGP